MSKLKSAAFAIFIACFLHLPDASATQSSCELEKDQCQRVRQVTSHWVSDGKSSALGSFEIGPSVEDAQPVAAERPSAEVDQHNAFLKEREKTAGPCRYAEARERIELTKAAFSLSYESFAECLAAAYAQARYSEVEGKWLSHVGEHEAWIVRNGTLSKVSADQKIQPAAARMLWASFATRELMGELGRESAQRAIASEGDGLQSSSESHSDPAVRELLGFAKN